MTLMDSKPLRSKTMRLHVWWVVLALLAGSVCVAGWAEAKPGDGSPRQLLERAHRLEAAKQYLEAIAAYRTYLAVKPESDEVRAAVAKLLAWQGIYDKAEAEYRDVLSRHPLDHDSRLGLARTLAWQKRFDAATEQYELVLRDEPSHIDALTGLADVRLWQGQPERALPYYEQVWSATGDAKVAARVRSLQADLAAARTSPPAFVVSPPASDRTQLDVARLLEEGRHLESKHDYPAASARYREALFLQPGNDEVLVKLARVLSWQGNHDEAASLYADVLARHPDDRDVLVALARVRSWQKQFGEAQRLYDAVLQADPTDLDARRGVAELAHWQGRRAEALAQYEAIHAETHDAEIAQRIQAVTSELVVSPMAAVGQGFTGLRLPYRDYAKIGYGHYSYTKGIADERDLLFEIAKPIGDQTLVLRAEPLNRFGKHDTPVSAEYYSLLWDRAWGYVAAQGTINPHFAPNYSVVGDVHQGLGMLHSSLAALEVSFGYRRLNYKQENIDLFLPAVTVFLPFNVWLTEKVYYVPSSGAITLASQLTWRPAERVQFYVSGSFGTSGERIVATQDVTRIHSHAVQGGAVLPLGRLFSVEMTGFYEDRSILYVRRGGGVSLIYHW
ncbi:MAG: tetratricopeptide repeat protein [Nitrospira sp.]|nr:tetratricopeptide repeat protein [Nitrospira sp.]